MHTLYVVNWDGHGSCGDPEHTVKKVLFEGTLEECFAAYEASDETEKDVWCFIRHPDGYSIHARKWAESHENPTYGVDPDEDDYEELRDIIHGDFD